MHEPLGKLHVNENLFGHFLFAFYDGRITLDFKSELPKLVESQRVNQALLILAWCESVTTYFAYVNAFNTLVF